MNSSQRLIFRATYHTRARQAPYSPVRKRSNHTTKQARTCIQHTRAGIMIAYETYAFLTWMRTHQQALPVGMTRYALLGTYDTYAYIGT